MHIIKETLEIIGNLRDIIPIPNFTTRLSSRVDTNPIQLKEKEKKNSNLVEALESI